MRSSKGPMCEIKAADFTETQVHVIDIWPCEDGDQVWQLESQV